MAKARKKVAKLIDQIRKREKLDSIESVFQAYPLLAELYYREKQGENFSTQDALNLENYVSEEKKKKLLLG